MDVIRATESAGTPVPRHQPAPPPPDRLDGWFAVIAVLDEGVQPGWGDSAGRSCRVWALRLRHEETGLVIDAGAYTPEHRFSTPYLPGRRERGTCTATATGAHRFRRTANHRPATRPSAPQETPR